MNISDIPTAIWILAGFGLAGAIVFALMVFGVIWFGKDKESSVDEVAKYVEENGIGETENDVRQYRKTHGL